MGHLVFVGDSYCAAYQGRGNDDNSVSQVNAHYPTYLNLSANWLNCDFYSFGYPGRSWWYSRNRLLKLIDSDSEQALKADGQPTFVDFADAFIFCHTEANRLNTSNPQVSTALLHEDLTELSPEFDPMLSTPYKLWSTMLVDGEFQLWAMERWFEEINERFGNHPMIHFNVTPYTVDISRQLKGVVYTTPLLNVSLGEVMGTDKEIIDNSLTNDQRYNHFNEHNQSAMARLIVDTLTNYTPGSRPIDLVKYNFDQPNPNAWRWPEAGFGTR